MLDMVPWEKINDFLLKIETCEDVGVFADTALKSMGELVYFDKGLAYILNGAGAVVGEKYCNFQQQVSEAYLEYYSKLDIPRSPGRDWKKEPPGVEPLLRFVDWSQMEQGEYYTDYIEPQKLKYSCHMSLRDRDGITRVTFVWDRSHDVPFGEMEQKVIAGLLPHMNNRVCSLYRNALSDSRNTRGRILLETAGLTKREMEIVRLLCQGVSQAKISKMLYISATTTRKHITHIYEKLKVSSMQELLVRLFNSHTNS